MPPVSPLLLDESNNDVLRSIPMFVALGALFYFLFPNSSLHKWKSRTERKLGRYAEHVTHKVLVALRLRDPHAYKLRQRRQRKQKVRKSFRHRCDFRTFNKSTRATFVPCRPPARRPDYKSVSSWYWDVDGRYVVRSSDHWSNCGRRIRTCWWMFDQVVYDKNPATPDNWLTGKCDYADFDFFSSYHVDFHNFYRATRAHYMPCPRPDGPPEFVSPSGSEYWDVNNESVIRCSDHWSNTCRRIADCWWTYEESSYVPRQALSGICSYADFTRAQQYNYGWIHCTYVNDRKLQALLVKGFDKKKKKP